MAYESRSRAIQRCSVKRLSAWACSPPPLASEAIPPRRLTRPPHCSIIRGRSPPIVGLARRGGRLARSLAGLEAAEDGRMAVPATIRAIEPHDWSEILRVSVEVADLPDLLLS